MDSATLPAYTVSDTDLSRYNDMPLIATHARLTRTDNNLVLTVRVGHEPDSGRSVPEVPQVSGAGGGFAPPLKTPQAPRSSSRGPSSGGRWAHARTSRRSRPTPTRSKRNPNDALGACSPIKTKPNRAYLNAFQRAPPSCTLPRHVQHRTPALR